ncbi:hypothetical protein EVB91_215 [Rhizobium phage RHph_I1_18]|nr:hypothetical protein EVB91_215 [Rhizobium phage RHph_I1_18]
MEQTIESQPEGWFNVYILKDTGEVVLGSYRHNREESIQAAKVVIDWRAAADSVILGYRIKARLK